MSLTRDELVPGAFFEFDNLLGLDEFQTEVAYAVKPELHLPAWLALGKLSEYIRPKGFNGNIKGITAVVLEDPYELLVSSEQRGVRFDYPSFKQSFRPDGPDRQYFDENTVAVLVQAEGTSVKGPLGLFGVEVYFVPLRPIRRKSNPPKGCMSSVSDNCFGHYYDMERGEKVYYVRVDDSKGETLRRPVSSAIVDQERLASIINTASLYNPNGVNGTRVMGVNPSVNYNAD